MKKLFLPIFFAFFFVVFTNDVFAQEEVVDGKVAVPDGVYRLEIAPIEGYEITSPYEIEVSQGNEIFYITARNGNSKVIYEVNLFERILAFFKPKNQISEEQILLEEAQQNATKNIIFFRFQDENGAVVYPPGPQIKLVQTSRLANYQLVDGWNFISFPLKPDFILMASDLIREVAQDGGYVTTVSSWNGDMWVEFTQRGDKQFGHDFKINPGRAYFLNSHKNSTLTVSGSVVEVKDLSFKLKKGWNAVGIVMQNKTGEGILNELGVDIAKEIARWNFGNWEVLVKEKANQDTKVFGFDFPIKTTEGYFVKLNKETTWWQD